MDPYIVKCECEGQEWFAHKGGARINSRETALLFTFADAVKFIEAWKLHGVKCDMQRVNRLTRERS